MIIENIVLILHAFESRLDSFQDIFQRKCSNISFQNNWTFPFLLKEYGRIQEEDQWCA